MFKRKEFSQKQVYIEDGSFLKKDSVIPKTVTSQPRPPRRPSPLFFDKVYKPDTKGRSSPIFEKSSKSNAKTKHSPLTGSYSLELNDGYSSLKSRQSPTNSAPSSVKGMRKKLAPLLGRKKKGNLPQQQQIQNVVDGEENDADILYYDDALTQKSDSAGIQSLAGDYSSDADFYLAHLGDRDMRTEYVLNNYRHPPPYPGSKKPQPHPKKTDSSGKNLDKSEVDAPMIKRLLEENNKALVDNASMINLWHSGSSSGTSTSLGKRDHDQNYENLVIVNRLDDSTDKLVMRTQALMSRKHLGDSTNSVDNTVGDKNLKIDNEKSGVGVDSIDSYNYGVNAGDDASYDEDLSSALDIYRKRQQYYTSLNTATQAPFTQAEMDELSAAGCKESVVDEDESDSFVEDVAVFGSREELSDRVNMEVPGARSDNDKLGRSEVSSLMMKFRKTSLDDLGTSTLDSSVESNPLHSDSTYVPPSPYLNADIPEWLHVYSKASPDLDKFLKWDMFRYHELDCWQTMLKRLYKKELEQIVLWFEEYRQSLLDEVTDRNSKLNANPVIQKSDV